MIGLNLSQNQSLRQEQIMAPQQIQALNILLSTIPEIEQRISEELAENPTLELLSSGTEDLAGNLVEDVPANTSTDDAAADAAAQDEALITLIQLSENWRDYAPQNTRSSGNISDEQEKREFLLNSLVDETCLQDHLLEQLREAEPLSEQTKIICQELIGSIDSKGYLKTHLADITIATQSEMNDVKHALTIIQKFDPPGIGARDLRECLILQLERKNQKKSKLYILVDKHLDKVAKNHIPQIAKALHVSTSEVYELLKQLRKLDPRPGSKMTSKGITYVTPEIFIEKDSSGNWQVRSNRDYMPKLRINPYYLKLLENPNTSKETKSYIREKIMNSKMLMRAISQRRSTIELIGESLIKFQRDFFDYGISRMKPLIMSQVADDIHVHETTVSRAIANKYVKTPHGLFALKHFFTSGYENDNGEMVSSLSIKQKLQKIINAESPKKPYSDQKLTQLLKEEGFKVARRTVAKYREELGIPSSNMRRSF